MKATAISNTADIGSPLAVAHDPMLLIISVVAAILAASVLIPSVERFRAARNRKSASFWLFTGAAAMALGVWGMSFCAILGLKLETPIAFDPTLTALAALPAICGALVSVAVSRAPIPGPRRVPIAAAAMASGFATMHYLCMQALTAPITVRYDSGLSIAAFLGSGALIWVGLHVDITLVLRTRRYWAARVAGSTILGLTISATHLLWTNAVSFYRDTTSADPLNEFNAHVLSLGIISVISALAALLLLAVFIDRRVARISRSLTYSESRFKALAETSACAIFTFTHKLTYVNPALSAITGYSEKELRSMPITRLLGRNWMKALADVSAASLGSNDQHEVKIQRKDGSTRWLYLALGRMTGPSGNQFIGSAFDISIRKEMEHKLRQLAYYDNLTGLPNRLYFIDILQDYLRNDPTARHCILLTVNLGRLKWINNNFGEDAGDELLRDIGRGLTTLTEDREVLARVGGHEFAILVPGEQLSKEQLSKEQLSGEHRPGEQEADTQHGKTLQGSSPQSDALLRANTLAETILEMLSHPHRVSGQEIHLRCQIGLTYPNDTAVEAKDLLREAYIAMNHAQSHNTNNFCLFDQAMRERAQSRARLESDLNRALSENQFELYYQPIVSLPSGNNIYGFEALIRWPRPDGTFVPPGEFIPITEETGLIASIGDWILETACQQLQAWNQQFGHAPYISVNVSSLQLYQPQFSERVAELIKGYDLAPGQLKLELTESVIVEDGPSVLLNMEGVLAAGCEIMIDDFGTGYSSLSYLSRFPASILKIDQSFIQNIGTAGVGTPIVKAIVSMARDLKLGIVAEGIETEHAARLMKEIGCDQAQGYLFSRPVPADQATQLLLNRQTTLVKHPAVTG